MSANSLLDAIKVVRDNERIASESYAAAAQEIRYTNGQELFRQLSLFEKHHLEILTTLVKSLEETGKFVHYAGKEFPLPPVFDIVAAQEPNTKSIMGIITDAIKLEKEAESAYSALADQINDPQGHQMFSRLSEEEHKHYLILREVYWTLNNGGAWKWSRP